MRLAKLSGKKLEDMFERGRWGGGTESHMFNKLEEIAGTSSMLYGSHRRSNLWSNRYDVASLIQSAFDTLLPAVSLSICGHFFSASLNFREANDIA